MEANVPILCLTGDKSMSVLERLTRREAIAWLEQWVLREPQVELEVSERLCDGMYLRTMRIPEGKILTGKIHIREHISIVHGDITIATETGTERLTGHHILVSPAGTKRVGWAHADTTWTTIHATDLKDINAVPDSLTTSVYPDIVEESCLSALPQQP